MMTKLNPNYARASLLAKPIMTNTETKTITDGNSANNTAGGSKQGNTSSMMKHHEESSQRTHNSTRYNSEFALEEAIKRNEEDGESLFTPEQLESLTLEQKMLIGVFVPKAPIRKDPNIIEI